RDPREAFHDARVAVETALALDPSLPELHATLADLQLFGRRDLRRSKESFDLALSIDPTYSTAHHFAAWHALINDDLNGALDHLRTALGFTPDGLELQTTVGIANYLRGAHEQGVCDLGEVLELDPEFSFARYELARILSGLERYDEALRHLDVLSAAEPRDTYAALTAFAAGRSGDPRPARISSIAPRIAGARRIICARTRSWGWVSDPTRSRSFGAAVESNEPWTVLLPLDRIFYDLRTDQSFRALVPVAVAR
nr:tetratricopeptide repeat protein [Candidatus Eremiobacteraeota bacterium]